MLDDSKLEDFDPALVQRLRSVRLVVFDFDGVFTDNRVYVLQDGTEAVCCYRGDGLGLHKFKRHEVDTVVLSSEVNPVVAVRCRKLGIRCIHGCKDKRAALIEMMAETKLSIGEVAFVGNDINDYECLNLVGVSVVVADAYKEVKDVADIVLGRNGGMGAVREFCELVCAAKEEGF